MTSIHTSRLYFGLPFLILCFHRCCSAAAPSVECKIINLEYVECTWNASTVNYNFSSKFANQVSYEACPEYILQHNRTVGCRVPMKHDQKFSDFNLNISADHENHESSFGPLNRKVQLNPPYGLSVKWTEHNSSLLLQWNSSVPFINCVVFNVNGSSQSFNVTGMSYSVLQIFQNKQYVFRVRSTVAESCGFSDLWSNWSDPVEWGSSGNPSGPGWQQGLYVSVSVLLLLLLGGLLCYCERKRMIFLGVVPDPSKNLQDLFHKHDGNVESWIHISKELKEAFQPDYTEPSCDVCEVMPPADASPTAEACPAPETENCEEPIDCKKEETNTEEEPSDPQSS